MIEDIDYNRLVAMQTQRHALRVEMERLKLEGREVPEGVAVEWASLCREIARLTETENVDLRNL